MATSPSLGADFNRFLVASASSNLGDGIRLGALPLLAISLTDDARLVALVNAATLMPWLVVGPLAGAVVDRGDRRRLMLVGQLGRAVLVALLAVLIATGAATIWWAVALALALGAGEVVVDSAAQASVPQLVAPDQLERANGRLIAAITVLDQVVGVTLGAVLFSVASSLPFAVDAATFAVGAIVLAMVRRPLQGARATPATSVRSDIAEGFRFVLGHAFLRRTMLAITTLNFAGNVGFGVLVVLVVDELGASEAAFGFVLGVGAVGGIIGAAVARPLVDRVGRARVLGTVPPTLVGVYLLNAAATELWMVALAFFISSFVIVCGNVPGQSVRQLVTPEPLLGRVVASFRTLGMGAAPLGAVLGGFVAEAAGVRASFVAGAVIGAAATVMMLAALRHLDDAIAAAGHA